MTAGSIAWWWSVSGKRKTVNFFGQKGMRSFAYFAGPRQGWPGAQASGAPSIDTVREAAVTGDPGQAAALKSQVTLRGCSTETAPRPSLSAVSLQPMGSLCAAAPPVAVQLRSVEPAGQGKNAPSPAAIGT